MVIKKQGDRDEGDDCCTRSTRYGLFYSFFPSSVLTLFFTFVLTAVAVRFKPGCAISAADTSLV